MCQPMFNLAPDTLKEKRFRVTGLLSASFFRNLDYYYEFSVYSQTRNIMAHFVFELQRRTIKDRMAVSNSAYFLEATIFETLEGSRS